MQTRRSVSTAASALNSEVSSAINSEAETSRRNSIQYGNSSSNETKVRAGPKESQDQSRPQKRSSRVTKKINSEAPKLKLFGTRSSRKSDKALPTANPKNTEVPDLSTAPLASESKKRKLSTSPDDDDGEREKPTGLADEEDERYGDALPEIEMKEPPRKRRGNLLKTGLDVPGTSAELPNVPETAENNLEISAPSHKRPPGRPRKEKPAVSGPETQKTGRRPPGRQRIPHPDPEVEAMFVRQGELKRAYRTIVPFVKAALDEMMIRELKELTSDPLAHQTVPQTEGVQAMLDIRLAEQTRMVEKEYELKKTIGEQRLVAEREVLKSECEVSKFSEMF